MEQMLEEAFFPADVLFPGLEGEHKAPVALGVGGLAHNPAGAASASWPFYRS